MAYDSMTMRIEHEKALNNKHKIYCPKCDKFVTGTLTDGEIKLGYIRHCPIHGEI